MITTNLSTLRFIKTLIFLFKVIVLFYSTKSAFTRLKTALSKFPVIAHYNLAAPTQPFTDASPWAMKEVLLQHQPDTSYRPIPCCTRYSK